MEGRQRMKIAVCSILAWSINSLNRDLCSIHRGFLKLGFDSKHVRPASIDGTTVDGLLAASCEEMTSPEFWQSHNFDLVVVNTWGQPKYNGLLRAIKASGAKVVARLDTDGYNSPWNGFLRYFRISRATFMEKEQATTATVKAMIKTILFAIPQVYDLKMLGHLELTDFIGIESEGAKAKFERLLRFYRRPDLAAKLRVIEHPVVPEIDGMDVPPAEARQNRIVCVGRWASPQKDTPLLIRTLGVALAARPDWQASLYGSGEQAVHAILKTIPESSARRITVHGPRPHGEIVKAYCSSKACLFTSVYEGCPISGEEALCLGCTIIGPPDVSAMHDLCEKDLGTLAATRHLADMAEGLTMEMSKWSQGDRRPANVAKRALTKFSAQAVCLRILDAAASSRAFD